MKKIYNKTLPAILMGSLLVGFGGCKESTLVLPDQIPLDDIEVNERGPVKQNNFQVVADEDEKVRFDISSVDTELVESVFFSYNRAGVKEVTEVKDFESLYIIENLPVSTPLPIEVWAKGKNGIESKKFSYVVSALPFPSKVIINTINVEGGERKINITMLNLSRSTATLYYKIDNAAAFTEVDLPISTAGETLVLKNISEGKHIVTYYVKDAKGGESEIRTVEIEVQPPAIVEFSTAESKSLWSVTVSSNQAGDGGGGPALIDGDPETFWHTPWSGDLPPWPHQATIDFGEDIVITKFIFLNRHNNGDNAPKDIDLQVSTDGQTFTTHQSFVNTNTTAGAKVTFDITTPVNTRYIRISNRTGYNASWVNYGEISFVGYRD
jgi:hypothetical protein